MQAMCKIFAFTLVFAEVNAIMTGVQPLWNIIANVHRTIAK